eukprot:CAMPEP_0194065416 /NCGR_PEP_ID=MMETSP0009_2-20130614/85457_1 /TAXON_ID=210454 /ORGANISM="Grammatophora oceanica, Strain CCMP 410" /LENGTH=339 /DNA_ID=CAMNT_0038718257 /DNA_START=74 /DNA_END=1090 /DNA_ORIENTATION=+
MAVSNSFCFQVLCFGLYMVYVSYQNMMEALGGGMGQQHSSQQFAAVPPKPVLIIDENFKRVHHENAENLFKPILEADYFLYDIENLDDVEEEGEYANVKALFCKLDWTKQKQTPNLVPRYGDIANQQWKVCKNDVSVSLRTIVRKARRYDEANPTKVHSLKEAGFIYHESRSGSTLAANMITVADPEANRVYSEPLPLSNAAMTGNEKLVRDVMYMLGRSNNFNEKRVFYKMRSTLTRHMSLMPQDVPWIFLYRKPEEVILSHFDPTEIDKIVCLSSRNKPHKHEIEMAAQFGKEHESLSQSGICAMRLYSIVQSAIDEHNRTKNGYFLNYESLPSSVW